MTQNTSPTPDQAGRWIITRFGGPDVLEWETWDPQAELPADQVLIRIITAGIAGPDNLMRVGGYPHPKCSKPGFTPGYDFVGEIISLGSTAAGSSKLSVGDWVTSFCMIGAHATHIILPVEKIIRIERTDDPIKVCALPLNYMTAFGMLRHAVDTPLGRGSSILIGSVSGGVGTAVAQLVHAFDMGITMIGTCSPSKFDYVRSLGVVPIDRDAPNLVEQVKALTEDGQGVDVAYDAIGSAESLRNSYLATKKDTGRTVAIGIMAEIATDGSGLIGGDSVNAAKILTERLQPRSSYWGADKDYLDITPDVWREDFGAVLNKIRQGKLDPVIAKYFRLSDERLAHEWLINGAGVKGKMVFLVDGELARRHGL